MYLRDIVIDISMLCIERGDIQTGKIPQWMYNKLVSALKPSNDHEIIGQCILDGVK